jgi:hypothetical protein
MEVVGVGDVVRGLFARGLVWGDPQSTKWKVDSFLIFFHSASVRHSSRCLPAKMRPGAAGPGAQDALIRKVHFLQVLPIYVKPVFTVC